MRQKNIPQPKDYEIRPFFRLIGAILTTFMAYLFIIEAIPLFSVKNLQLSECHQLKLSRQLMCELGNWLTLNIPHDIQGPAEAISRLLFAGIMLFFTWHLLKPLFAKTAHSKHG